MPPNDDERHDYLKRRVLGYAWHTRPMPHRQVTQRMSHIPMDQREAALAALIDEGLLVRKVVQSAAVGGRPRTVYLLTDDGKKRYKALRKDGLVR